MGENRKIESVAKNKNSMQAEDKALIDGTAETLNKPDEKDRPEEPVFQIRPCLHEKFKPLVAKEIIHNILFDRLSTKVYNKEEAAGWCVEIADSINGKLKDLELKKYKYVVDVILGEQHGAGIKVGTRCIWDAEADSYAHDNFINDTIFCVAIVYAIYHY